MGGQPVQDLGPDALDPLQIVHRVASPHRHLQRPRRLGQRGRDQQRLRLAVRLHPAPVCGRYRPSGGTGSGMSWQTSQTISAPNSRNVTRPRNSAQPVQIAQTRDEQKDQ